MRNQNDKNSGHELSDADYYTQQYNARASIPDHPFIFTRWQKDSALVRRTHAGLLDLSYGTADKERLDFYPAYDTGAPLLVFIHGGWWRSLDKSDFTFIVPAYRRAGFNVALTNYTLAPEASIDEITMQQVRALTWLYRNAERLGFDRRRIVVAGHSADANSALKLSPAWMPQSHPAPFITAVGDQESEEFKRQTDLIAQSWSQGFRQAIPLNGMNHLTICDGFGDPGHPLCAATCELLRSA